MNTKNKQTKKNLVSVGHSPLRHHMYPISASITWYCTSNGQNAWVLELRCRSRNDPVTIIPSHPLGKFVFPTSVTLGHVEERSWFPEREYSTQGHSKSLTEQKEWPPPVYFGIGVPTDQQTKK